MKYPIILTGLISLLGISCEDTGPVNNVSMCINSKIEMYPPTCGEEVETSVDEYLFQSELVYVFDYDHCCCDYNSPVISTNCDTLGYLGGFAGNNTIHGEDFSNAHFLRRVWP